MWGGAGGRPRGRRDSPATKVPGRRFARKRQKRRSKWYRAHRVFGPRDAQGASHALAIASSMVPVGSAVSLVNRSSARSCVSVVLLALALASSVAAKSASSVARGPEKVFVVMTPPPDPEPPFGDPRRGAWCR